MKIGDYEVGISSDLQKKYGLYAENRPVLHLRKEHVPPALHALILLVERYGVSDDIMREDPRGKLSDDEKAQLHEAVVQFEDDLDAWLAGPAADEPVPTEEYVAFTCFTMLAYGPL